jgi:hypothetical protein
MKNKEVTAPKIFQNTPSIPIRVGMSMNFKHSAPKIFQMKYNKLFFP